MTVRRLLRDESGSGAAEFMMVLPLLLMLIIGTIDVGLYAWRFNQLEKAAQAAVRMAVVTNPVASDLTSTNYIGNTSCGTALTGGDAVCAAALGQIRCTNTGNCFCDLGPCAGLTRNGTAFTNIANRARVYAPWLADTNMVVIYRGSGLGYAGSPGMDINPFVTVRLTANYTPLSTLFFRTSFALPTVERTLTMEDGQGAVSS